MVLHRSNFEILARFSFQQFAAEWRIVSVETMGWAEESNSRLFGAPSEDDPEKDWLRVRIEVPDMSSRENQWGGYIPGIGRHPSYTVVLDRASIPPEVFQPFENRHNTPDIAGRWFSTLICQKREFRDGAWNLKPADAKKNAWIMRDEFMRLNWDDDSDGLWNLRQFLNKWGLWKCDSGFREDRERIPAVLPPPRILVDLERNRPDFVLAMPHLLKEQQERYSKALLPSHARDWLRSHPLNLETANEPPFFFVRRSYCTDAIEATITIDHLAKRQFGFCKRCQIVFQKPTRHKKSYCSERCYNAAGVERWRNKQRKSS